MDWKKLLNEERRRKSYIATDGRTEFERDYDRSVFSAPIKRLQDKAQVFPLERHDSVRNRLTHSMEVSCVARGLATRIGTQLEQSGRIDKTSNTKRNIEMIAATCGLLHDLGNPPFGHAGEGAIRSWFDRKFGRDKLKSLLDGNEQRASDFLLFEGNAQTLRLVSRLQILADSFGLNLTLGTLSALRKYLPPSHQVNGAKQEFSKMGFFRSEKDLVEEIATGTTGSVNVRNPITYIVEAADDAVYGAADIEDAVRKKILRWHDILEAVEAEKGNLKEIDIINGTMKVLRTEKPHSQFPDEIYAAAFRTACIERLVAAASDAFIANYERIMEGSFSGSLLKVSTAGPLIKLLKTLGRTRVYCTKETLSLEIMGNKVIHDLMDLFWQGAQDFPTSEKCNTIDFSGKIGALFSENYSQVFQEELIKENSLVNYCRFQLLTDYICGMTDSFARRLHADLTNRT